MVNLNRDIKAKTYGASEDFQITMEGRKAPINNAGSGITIETPLTATEMIGQLPNMKIVKTPTYVKGPDGFRKIEDAYPNSYGGQAVGVVDLDTKAVNIFRDGVSKSFTVRQPKDMAKDIDRLTGNAAIFTGGGTLNRRATLVLLGDLQSRVDVGTASDPDIISSQLIVTDHYDASGSLKIILSPFRLSCYNQLTVAINSAKSKYTKIHRSSMTDWSKTTKAADFFKAIDEDFHLFTDICKGLRATTMSDDDMNIFTLKLLNLTDKDVEEWSKNDTNKHNELMYTIRYGSGIYQTEAAGTAWAAFNGVTEYYDHLVSTRARRDIDRTEQRFANSITGGGQVQKQRAWDLLLKEFAPEAALCLS